MNRLRAGYCKMVNPYGRQIYTISLAPRDVDGFVFWTKNIGPLLKHLPEVRERGYAFIVQHSINGYLRELEDRVIDDARTVEAMRRLANVYGPDAAVWRYDPIVFTSLTPVDWHRRNFARLARALAGTTNEVVISFAQVYKKTQRNMDAAARASDFAWRDHEQVCQERGRELIGDFARAAAAGGMRLTVCSQPEYVIQGVAETARCIDAERLERVSGKPIAGKMRQKGGRKECYCCASKDIGEYDTCPHGCVYCYAVQQRDVALSRYRAHDPEGEFLFPPSSLPSPRKMV